MSDQMETKIRKMAQSIEPSADFSDRLWKQISNSQTQTTSPRRASRWVWIPATAVLALTIVFFVLGPQNVAAAFRSLLAYLPGIGFVQNGDGTLYLSEPVALQQGEATLIIEKVVSDAEKTVVYYHIDGLPTVDGRTVCFYDNNQLLLPDGSTRMPIGGGVMDNLARVEFAPLPKGVTQATLVTSMNFPDSACTAAQEWQVAFALGTTAPVSDLIPVVEIPQAQTAPVDGQSEKYVRLVLDRVAELQDGYLLAGYVDWADTDWRGLSVDPSTAYAVDAKGNRVELLPTEEDIKDNQFNFVTAGKDFAAPITLHIEGLHVQAEVENSQTFTFDAGQSPQIGQTWKLDQELEIAGRKINVISVRAVEEIIDSISNKGYAFEMNSDADVNGFIFCSGDQAPSDSWGQIRDNSGTSKILESYYPQELPTGLVTCKFNDLQIYEKGDWQLEWQPSAEMQ